MSNQVCRQIIRSLFLFSLFISSLVGQEIPKQGLASITAKEMKHHVFYLASDVMQGRDTPSPELDTCAAYIAQQFQADGLISYGSEPSYLQPFGLLKSKLSSPNTFRLSTDAGDTVFAIKDDFVPLHLTTNRKISAPIVFAGYGITAPEYGYDDYSGLNAKGKLVFIFKGEPQEQDSTSVFEGRKASEYSKLRIKVENAVDHGAIGLILVSTPKRRFRRPPNPWPSLMRIKLKDAIPLTLEQKIEKRIVCVQIGRTLADALLEESGKTLEDLYDSIETSLTPQSFKLTDKTVTIETNLKAKKTLTNNVVGYWEGSDPELKKEFVVIGAHYDHIGVLQDSVYNGADDNASGTAGILEIAEAFAKSPVRPKRSILFLAFAGEEKGLFGSRYYTENPLVPLDQTVAMLNLDMISRNDTNEVAIIGTLSSPDLKKINEEANTCIGMDLKYDQDRYFLQSDHYSFYRKGIPVLFYNTKNTPDLHKPTDDPEKIIPEKMARIGRLIFGTAWKVANRTERPNYVKFR